MIISKVTKNQSFTLSLEDTFFEKPYGGLKLTSLFRVKKNSLSRFRTWFGKIFGYAKTFLGEKCDGRTNLLNYHVKMIIQKNPRSKLLLKLSLKFKHHLD